MDTVAAVNTSAAVRGPGAAQRSRGRFGIDPVAAGGAATPEAKMKELRSLAGELESVFLAMVFSQMRESTQRGSLFCDSAGERTFAPLLDAERARAVCQRGGLGISDALVKQLGARYRAALEGAAQPADARAAETLDIEG